MKILITGGAGFIGSHLAERLVKEGHEVYVWDDLSSGQGMGLFGEVYFKNIDVQEAFKEWAFFDSFLNFDQIYHLACPASPVWYQKDPVKTMLTNVVGTNNMLRVAKETGARILLTSTSATWWTLIKKTLETNRKPTGQMTT